MNPSSLKEAEKFVYDFNNMVVKPKNTDIVVCPPFVYLDSLSKNLITNHQSLKPRLGAQDFFWENKGSYTGEISIPMLKNLGVKYVIVGHSERRKYLDATNKTINKKIKIALKSGLKVLFCIGEEKRDEDGKYLKFIKKEITEGLAGIVKKDLKNLIICYEPVWAIGSRKADSPENFLQTSIYIRRVLFFKFGRKIAHDVPILYGGSVNSKNAKDFLEKGNAQGLLIGRASLKAKNFVETLKNI